MQSIHNLTAETRNATVNRLDLQQKFLEESNVQNKAIASYLQLQNNLLGEYHNKQIEFLERQKDINQQTQQQLQNLTNSVINMQRTLDRAKSYDDLYDANFGPYGDEPYQVPLENEIENHVANDVTRLTNLHQTRPDPTRVRRSLDTVFNNSFDPEKHIPDLQQATDYAVYAARKNYFTAVYAHNIQALADSQETPDLNDQLNADFFTLGQKVLKGEIDPDSLYPKI